MTNTKKVCLSIVLALLVISIAAFFVSAADGTPTDFLMEYGAEARIDEHKGLRFTASVGKSQIEKWQRQYSIEAGMVFVPYYYITLYGELSVENLFGQNALYSFDINDSRPTALNVNIPTETFTLSENKTKYLLRADLADIENENLALEYTALAYVKLTNGENTVYYTAEYNNHNILNSTRSYYDVVKSANDKHSSTSGGYYSQATAQKISSIKNSISAPITNVAVFKNYEAAGMTGETGGSPLAWCGNTENDRANIFAWYDFQTLNKEITGKSLNIKYINKLSELNSAENYIILGGELAELAGLDYSGITTDNGHKIVKQNGNIYLYGKSGYGTANAVYAFLKQAYGIEFFTDTVYTLEKGVYAPTSITNEVFNPSVDYLWAHDGLLFRDDGSTINYKYQMRLGYVNYWHIQGGSFHAISSVFPKSEYASYYYNDDVIDFNSEGEINTGNKMVRAVADWLYSSIMAENSSGQTSNKTVYFFGPADERKWSESSASKSNLQKYGSNSGEYLLFMNSVTELLNTDPKYADIRAVEIAMLAYNKALQAPTSNLSKLETNKVTDRGVTLKVMFAPIEMNVNDKPTSTVKDYYGGNPAEYYSEYAKWQEIFGEDNVYVWRYSAIFSDFFVPVNTVEYMQENYKAIAGSDGYIKHLMDQGTNKSAVQTNYQALLIYLKGKLGKDVNADFDKLIDEFVTAYYGKEAGQYIKQLMSAQQTHFAYIKANYAKLFGTMGVISNGKDFSGCHYLPEGDNSNYYNSKYWSKNCSDDAGKMLKEWYSYIESALASTTDADRQNRIKVEAIAIRYISLKAHNKPLISGDNFTNLYSDAVSLGITRRTEGSSLI